MILLVNTSNIKKSGALQVSLSFLQELKSCDAIVFHIVVSSAIERQLDFSSYGVNFIFYRLDMKTPFSKGYTKFKKQIQSIENSIKPDCVFSVFGPTYWTPKAPHLSGFAYVWAINPDSRFIRTLKTRQYFKQKLENAFKSFYFKKNSKYFVVETGDVKERLAKYVGVDKKNIWIVNNTFNHHFEKQEYINEDINITNDKRTFKLLTVSSNFPHKNLQIIKKVDQQLVSKGHNDVVFYITITTEDYNNMFGFNERIRNLGTVRVEECPGLYKSCDALFLPTLLECFSASYPEAMIMQKPIITSDLDFARSICHDAALYFDPFDAADIADRIISLKSNKRLQNTLIRNGLNRVKHFPSAKERAKQYVELCKKVMVLEHAI